jgi:hypothetical protein
MTSGQEIDYDAIDPGIRKLVRWCNENNFRTTDSGDGKRKPKNRRTMRGPHVVIRVGNPRLLVDEAIRLKHLVRSVLLPGSDIHIECTYSPIDEVALVILMGTKDSDLKK